MKSTLKRLWLFLVAAVLTFTTVLAVGCAKKDCGNQHSYGDWQEVSAPTETNYGDKKHVCSKCGAEEHEQIPMLDSLSAAVNTPEAAKGSGVNIEIEPFEFTNKKAEHNLQLNLNPTSLDWVIRAVSETTVSVEGGYAYAGLNEEGYLYAYGKISYEKKTVLTDVKSDGNGGEQEPDTSTEETRRVLSFLFEKDEVYAEEKAFSKGSNGEFTVPDGENSSKIHKTITEILAEQDETLQLIAQIVFGNPEKLIAFANTDLRPFVNDVAAALGVNFEEAQQRALSILLKEVKTDGGYELVTRNGIFSSIANDINTLKINELIDKYCGAGTFAMIETLPDMLDMKVGDLVAQLAAKGVTVAKITAFADKVVQFYSGDATATLKTTLGIDLETIVKSYENVTIGQLIAGMIGSTDDDAIAGGSADGGFAGVAGVAGAAGAAGVRGGQTPALPVPGDIDAATAAKIAQLKTKMAQAIASLKEATLPQYIANASEGETTEDEIKVGISSAALAMDRGVSIKVTLDNQRVLTGYEISLSKELLALVGEATKGTSSDGKTTVDTQFTINTAFKLTVSFGAEKAANKADFNAEEFVKSFAQQPQTDGGNS